VAWLAGEWTLAVHILISFCNGRLLGMPKLGLLDTATSQVQILELPDSLSDGNGATGLALSSQHVYAIIQDQERHLAVFDRTTMALCGAPSLPEMADAHSLWVDGESLYVVSTGTDEVVRIGMNGSEIGSHEVYWRPDTDAPRADVHHLNAILGFGGDLFVSGFGRKSGATWSSARDGFIVNVTEQRVVASGIEHPHSLVMLGDSLAFCESRRSTVQVIGDPRMQQLPGYTRGMCVAGETLYVATSTGRRVSKSTGLVNNADDPGAPHGGCAICRLSATSLAVEEIIDLSNYGYEIYDLLPVGNVEAWPVTPLADWQGRLLRRFMVAFDQQRAGTGTRKGATETAENAVRVEALERELAELQQVNEQRVAEAAATIETLRQQLAESTQVVQRIQRTRLWRVGTQFWRAKDWLKGRLARHRASEDQAM
jgi:hypothetical protein